MSSLKTIEIALRANVAHFSAGLGVASAQVRQFSKDTTDFSKTTDKHLEKIGKTSMLLGAGMLAGFGIATTAAMGFEKQMSEVGAVSGATAGELGQLRQAALDAGAATVFSASQAAVAEAELAKAGVSTGDILSGALTGALNLASAGNLDLGRSAEIAANAMTTFGLKGSDVGHVADVLAAGANKSAADVEDMGQALQQSGLVAAQLGLTLDDTSAALAMFAQSGLRGSDAGTSLKTMLLSLNPKSKEAAEEMRRLGLKFFDARGNFVGLEAAAGQLQMAMGGLTQEQRLSSMQTIFGTDAIRAANILYTQGASGVEEWTAKVNDQGYAAELAAKKTDNLAGDLEQLKGSIETGLIQGGSHATGVLRGLTQTATDVVNAFGTMPAGMQMVSIGFLGVAGAAMTAGGAAATVYPKYKQLLSTLQEMGPGGERAARGLSKVAGGLSAVGGLVAAGIAGWTLWENKVAEADEKAAALHNRLIDNLRKESTTLADVDRQTGQIKQQQADLVRELNSMSEEAKFNPLSFFLDADTREQQQRFINDLGRTGEALDQFNARVRSIAAETGASEADVKQWMGSLEDMGAHYELAGDAAGDFLKAQLDATGLIPKSKSMFDVITSGASDAADATESATEKLDKWHDAVRAMWDPLFGLQDANAALADAQARATDAAIAYQTALASYGPNSQPARDALRELDDANRSLLEANIDLDVASRDLMVGIQQGTVPIDEAKRAIDEWTAAGRINADQAAVMKRKIDEAAWSAMVLGSISPMLTIGVDTSQFDAAIGHVTRTLSDIGLAGALRIGAVGLPSFANGGIVTFAGGGEYHSAQIAGAGAMRVWAEPETGGESYIPHAMSKRARSTVVLAETARRFGYTLTPATAGGPGAPTGGGQQIDQRSYTAHFPNYVGDRSDLERWMENRMRDLIRSKAD